MTATPENNLITRIRTILTTRNMLKNMAGLVVGAIAGFIYYRTVGCTSGGCAITSNPYMSILWGGVMGYLLADIFKIRKKTPHQENQAAE